MALPHDLTTDLEPAAQDSSASVASHWTRPGYFVRSFATLGVAQVGTWVAGAAITILVPRYLGDVNYGKYSFAVATVSLVALLASLGTTTLVTREVAREPERARYLVVNALITRVPLSILACVAMFAFVGLAVHDQLTRTIFFVASAGILFGSLTEVSLAALQGMHRMGSLAIFAFMTRCGFGVLGVIVLFMGGRVVQLVEASVTLSAVGLVVILVLLHGQVRLRAPISPQLMWSLVVGGLPFFVWQAALVVYGQIDVVMLSLMTRDAVVGWYSVAYKIVLIPGFLPVIVMTVLFPALSAAAADAKGFEEMARRALHFLVLLSVPMSIGMLLLADRIISFLGYPAAFQNSVLPLAILSIHMPLVAIDMLIATILITRDRQRAWALVGVAAALLNPLLNIVAIRWSDASLGNGAVGSAVVTVLTEFFLLCAGLCLLPDRLFDRRTLAGIARCVLAVGMMSAVVWLMRPMPLQVAVAGGGLSYLVAAFLLRAITLKDVSLVYQALAHRGARDNRTPAEVLGD